MSNQEGNVGASRRYHRGVMGIEGSFIRELGQHMKIQKKVEKPALTRLERAKDVASSIVRGVVSRQEQAVPLDETQIDADAQLTEVPLSDAEAEN